MAREAAYPNAETERAALQEVDQAVFEKVREYERWAFDSSQTFLTEQAEHVRAAADLMAEVEVEVRRPLAKGGDADELAVTFQRLRQQAEAAKATLRNAIEASRSHEERVADPYASMCKMWDRFPVLRPRIVR